MPWGDHTAAIALAREAGLVQVLRDVRTAIGQEAGLGGCPPVRLEEWEWIGLFDRVQEQLEVMGQEEAD